ncbi:monovalent cation:proton antiporter-2 (CPA2) family protein [Gallaecimonas pentaromativorans]|uniref:Kef-type potassium/proton antiporter (CPA2 family) n=1 Tax=Gallaecimonas pentaromativorans TaxID=584787 RepID=A0A3N1PT45_9GAMM|nr:monovalent cation:proton antiporter-2 (CPA2) family protein [Gallaecimonas pentaromativorans]MED5523810.1 monovalent cation:proton antiporter-2 (CPA2) family protein [Pseudomonadota bacterium]ROQ27716.1 Kef-type potassium/proton antiporter (CPA2 family) [Gallaecimonas pentaromativorans]
MSHPELILLFLLAAVIGVPLFRRLKLSPVLAYLAVGLILGPSAFNLVGDTETLLKFSELGIIMMLFVLGLELSPSRVIQLKSAIFVLGTGQLVLTTLVFTGVGMAFHLSWQTALVIGAALSLSSTAFAVQLLKEHGLITSKQGQDSFAILLFQDMAVVPLLLLLAALSPGGGETHLAPWYLIIGALAGVALFARFGLARLMEAVVASKVREVLTAMTLLLVLGSAWLMEELGLSAGMGAFLAGTLLANSSYRHQLHADIEPFKGLLLGLFFMAIGMTLKLELLWTAPRDVLVALLIFLLVKVLVLWPLARLWGHNWLKALQLAVLLSEGGEFAFVMASQAGLNGLITERQHELLVMVVGLSMVLTPWFFGLVKKLCGKVTQTEDAPRPAPSDKPRVIVAGFGRFGQIVGRVLAAYRIPFIALDKNATHVSLVRKYGAEVFLGDATEYDLLDQARAHEANILVVAVDDKRDSMAIVALCKARFPNLKLLVRAIDRLHAIELKQQGINKVFRETFSAGLQATHATLMELGVPESEVLDIIKKFREHDEALLESAVEHLDDEQARIRLIRASRNQLAKLLREDAEL